MDDSEHWNASATATADLTSCIQQRAVAAAAAVVVLAASVVRPTCRQALPGSHPSSDNITDVPVQHFNYRTAHSYYTNQNEIRNL